MRHDYGKVVIHTIRARPSVLVPRILTGPDTKVEQRTSGTETWQQLVVSSKMGLYIVVTFGYCYYGFGWRCYDDTLYYKYAIVSLLSGQSMSIVYYVILWIRGVCDLMSNLGNWNRYHHNPDCILFFWLALLGCICTRVLYMKTCG